MSDKEDITWETDLRLFGPEMVRGWSLAMLASWLVMMLILGIVFIAQGEVADLLPLAGVLLAVTAGLWLLGLLVMAVVFRGGLRVRYKVSERGVRMDTLDKVAKTSNRLAIALGALSRKPGLIGAGLINRSRESEAVAWDGVFHARLHPQRRLIVLEGAWRSLMLVQCTAENYPQVVQRVQAEKARHGASRRLTGKSPLPAYLGRTFLVALASFPIFALHQAYDLGVFLPLLMFCFALAMIWLIPLFGWVVLACLGLMAFTVLARLLEETPSYIRPGQTFTLLEVMSTGDWLMLGLAGLGAAVLVWLSLGALRGRIPVALIADRADMG